MEAGGLGTTSPLLPGEGTSGWADEDAALLGVADFAARVSPTHLDSPPGFGVQLRFLLARRGFRAAKSLHSIELEEVGGRASPSIPDSSNAGPSSAQELRTEHVRHF